MRWAHQDVRYTADKQYYNKLRLHNTTGHTKPIPAPHTDTPHIKSHACHRESQSDKLHEEVARESAEPSPSRTIIKLYWVVCVRRERDRCTYTRREKERTDKLYRWLRRVFRIYEHVFRVGKTQLYSMRGSVQICAERTHTVSSM